MKKQIAFLLVFLLLCGFASAKETWNLTCSAPKKGTQENPAIDVVTVSVKIKGEIGGEPQNQTVKLTANIPVWLCMTAQEKLQEIADKLNEKANSDDSAFPEGWEDCIIISVSPGQTQVTVEVNSDFVNTHGVEVDITDLDFKNNSAQKKVDTMAFAYDYVQGPIMVLQGEPSGETPEGLSSTVTYGIFLDDVEYSVEVTVGEQTRTEILIALAVALKNLTANAGYTINPIVYGYGIYVLANSDGVAAGTDDQGLVTQSILLGSEYYPNLVRFEAAIQSWISSQTGIIIDAEPVTIQDILVYLPIE
jgi:hypothetical protein